MLESLLKNERVRFLLVGGVNTAIAYGLFILFYSFLGSEFYLLAYIISYVLSLLVGYLLQRKLVFKVKGHLILDFVRYSTVQFASFGINLLLLPLMVEILGFSAPLAQAIIAVITVVGSYFAHRAFSFHRKGRIGAVS